MQRSHSIINTSILLSAILLFIPVTIFAQQKNIDPVHWTYSIKPTSGNSFELHILATIDEGWHIYAQIQPPEAISQPTLIAITHNPLIKLDGKPKEIGDKETYIDKTAGIRQFQYGHKVEFIQNFSLRNKVKLELKGAITFQACTSEQCLSPKTVNFSVPVE